MLNKIRQDWPGTEVSQGWFLVLAISILAGVLGSMVTDSFLLLGLPGVVLLMFLVLVDFRWVYFLAIASLPLSMEFAVSGGLATDLPSEPLMVGLMFVFLVYALGVKGPDPKFLKHPITIILLLHLAWIGVVTVTSSNLLVSVKYLLAKTWYIVVFYFMTGLLIRSEKDFKKLFWWFFIPLMLTVLIILLRHSTFGFSFKGHLPSFAPLLPQSCGLCRHYGALFAGCMPGAGLVP